MFEWGSIRYPYWNCSVENAVAIHSKINVLVVEFFSILESIVLFPNTLTQKIRLYIIILVKKIIFVEYFQLTIVLRYLSGINASFIDHRSYCILEIIFGISVSYIILCGYISSMNKSVHIFYYYTKEIK